MLSSTDILFVFSGGQGNYDPFKSLGGDPSVIEISEISQGLFNSLTDDQLKCGLIDYRCFYIFNQSDTDTLYDLSIYTENSSSIGCYVGINKTNDIQKITLSGSPSSGNLVLSYNEEEFTVNFSSNPNQFALNFKQQLNNLGLLGVIVEAESKTGFYDVNIKFEGDSGYKYHPLIKLISNNLFEPTSFFISKVQDGSPINTIVPKTPNILTKPEKIDFQIVTLTESVNLTTLRPNEGLPVWLKREVPPATAKQNNLLFQFKIKGRIIS